MVDTRFSANGDHANMHHTITDVLEQSWVLVACHLCRHYVWQPFVFGQQGQSHHQANKLSTIATCSHAQAHCTTGRVSPVMS